MRKRLIKLAALGAVLLLVAAACGDSSEEEPAAPAETEADAPAATEAAPAAAGLPGEGTSITMARADWSTGYFQAAVYQQLLEELGYSVTDPSELELGPSLAYLSMAQGDFDFWVNSWYPGHLSWWEPELPDGTTVGSHLEVVGEELIAGGLQGYLITKAFADEYGITTMDEFNANADAMARATLLSTRSPLRCPYRSLTSLKPSTSIIRRPSGWHPVPAARFRARPQGFP